MINYDLIGKIIFLINDLSKKSDVYYEDAFIHNNQDAIEKINIYIYLIEHLEKFLYEAILQYSLDYNIELMKVFDLASLVLKIDKNKKECYVVKCKYIKDNGKKLYNILEKINLFSAIDLLRIHNAVVILDEKNNVYASNLND